MRSHWPTAISTEPPCTQLTPSSANEHVENADTRGAEIAQNEPLPIDPLENEIGAERKLGCEIVGFRFEPIPAIRTASNRRSSKPPLIERRHTRVNPRYGQEFLVVLS